MLELEKFLPYRLSVLANRISEQISRTYRDPYGMSVTEWRVVAILGRFPGATATEVAERAAMDKVAVSRAVRSLENQGRVVRESHRADGRARHLTLSESGRAVYDAIAPAALDYEKRLLGALDADARARLGALLNRLADAVDAIEDEPPGAGVDPRRRVSD